MNDTEKNGLDRRHLSNTENYDKVILNLSSTGLMFSIAIINFINNGIVWLFCIYFAWLCFIFSIALSLLSFIVGNKAIEDDNPYDNKYIKRTKWLNCSTGVLLIIAFSMVAIFAGLNIN